MSTSGLDANRSVNRYWTLTPGGGLAASGGVTFNYPATDVDSGATPAQFIVRRFSAGAWSTTTGSGTPTTTATTVTGLGAFGNFAIGNQLIDHYVVSAPASQGYRPWFHRRGGGPGRLEPTGRRRQFHRRYDGQQRQRPVR